ncbi:MAG: transcription antitermination factor NusB, partial [Acidimicrobiia bacterium]
MTSRETAFAALLRVEDGAYSNVLLPTMLRDSTLDARDRAFATDLVYGTLRQQRALDYLVGLSADRPVEELDAPTRVALRLGAYQLTRNVPAHAAVGETVAVAPRRARGYVNAVLRALAGIAPQWPWPGGEDVAALAVRLSYPDWIVDELVAQYGLVDARASLEVANEPPPVALRVNTER